MMRQQATLLSLFRAIVPSTTPSDSFDWTTIKPSTDLEYHPCYAQFQCARLILPLDYTNPSDTRTVAIAITKYPASVPDNDPTFGGSLFLGNGGPGGSSTELARGMAPDLQQRFERSGRRHYEYIGIDGRGIGYSWPSSNCFAGDLFSRQSLRMESRGAGLQGSTQQATRYGLALNDGFGERCSQADKTAANGGQIMGFASTASVARDMVQVADKIAQLRSRQRASTPDDGGSNVARVQYLGFSYGTVLGHYFASLFPERVGRLILDGVADPKDYATGPGWMTALADTDKVRDAFFSGCHEAGSRCALRRIGDRSGKQIENRFNTWLRELDHAYLTSVGPGGDVRIITGDDIRAYMFSTLYAPLATFQTMASDFDAAMAGNTTNLFDTYFRSITPQHETDGCMSEDPSRRTGSDGGYPVRCGDGDDVTDKDVAWWQRYKGKLESSSSMFGRYWASMRFVCSGWKFKSNWRFTGPFTSPASRKDASGNPSPGYPAAPNLYLGSRLDPVTPLRSAQNMRNFYPGAGLAILEAAGHTVLGAGAKNKCIDKIVEDYLETGLVAAEEIVCEAECSPWDKHCDLGYII